VNVKSCGKEFGGISLNVWRAPTDNDRNERNAWEFRQLHASYPSVLDYEIGKDFIRFDVGIAHARSTYLLTATLTYAFSGNGVEIAIDYKQADESWDYFRYFPRVGLKLKLPKEFSNLRYLAYGEGETYSDLYEYAIKKEYSSTVEKEYFHYAKPQESGSHYLPEYAELSDGTTYVRAEGMKSFSALLYSAETLTSTKHDDELPNSDYTYFSCDYAMSGLGTNSCGPIVRKDYQVPQEDKGVIRFFFGQKNQ